MKKINRRLLIYFLLFKKKLFIISNDHKNLTRKFEVTDGQIRSLSKAMNRAFKINESCMYSEQLASAEKFAELLYAKYPFSTIINKILLANIDDLRYGNKKENVEPLPSMYIENK